jgi:hypothetical protein
MAQDLRRRLADNAKQRDALALNVRTAEQEEHELIAEAWRTGIHPTEIVQLSGRSLAHIRKLRPKDVPPLRTGGGAAKKRTTRRTK